jgi:hypothetical protein
MTIKDNLPDAFNPDLEIIKFLINQKKKASKNISFTVSDSLENAKNLAYYLYAYNKFDQSLEVCKYLSQIEFNGNFNIWGWVELTFVLMSRILKKNNLNDEAKLYIHRIKSAGFIDDRLNGLLLCDEDIQECISDGDKIRERDFRMCQMNELCFIIELGGSRKYPIKKTEQLFLSNLEELQKLLKVT